MAKDSYLRKHLAKTGEERTTSVHVQISPEKKEEFAAGRVILIDKPLHWTSFDVVRKVRNAIGIKKVGHAGTLDPLATGLLIICSGKFTKQINEYMSQEKEYTGSFTLGATTPTYDLESDPGDFKDISEMTTEAVQAATAGFTGHIKQFPPVYSAIKKKGTPLYELARRGEDIELEARDIFIKEFEITSVELPVINFRIVCSTGTYIRSIAHDFGAVLGCGAYLSALRRTRIGNFKVEEADTIEEFLASLSRTDS